MSVRLLNPDDEGKWDQYVSEASTSSVYHCVGWKRVIEESFGHRTYYLLSEDGVGRIRGILPLIHLKSRLFGSFMVSMPYFNYGGVCAQDRESYRALLEEAIRIAKAEGAAHVELREDRLCDNNLPVKTSKVGMRLQLPSAPDALWTSFPSKLRSQILRPQKEGLTCRIGRLDELDAFYHVFSVNMRDLGTPVYPKGFFRSILDRFKDNTWICSVYKDRIPVASGFLIGFRNVLEIPWASSLRAYNLVSPNMLLYWSVLRFACMSGYTTFDFGRSTPGEGSYRFKAQWGAKPNPLYWYYWLRHGGAPPELNPRNPKYRMAINLWKRLPIGLTQFIGPSIVKNLP